VYIGQTSLSLSRRKKQHKETLKKGEQWGRFPAALCTAGFQAFAWEQIDKADTPEELDRKEQSWIAFYNSTSPEHGYNVSPGGGLVAPETRRKMSEAGKGKPKSVKHRRKIGEANKGRHHSEETRQKLRAIQSGKYAGEDNPFYGQHHSEETRCKMSEAWERRRTRPISEETRRKLSEAHKGKVPWNKGRGKK
jgi:group I intron endonuclease